MTEGVFLSANAMFATNTPSALSGTSPVGRGRKTTKFREKHMKNSQALSYLLLTSLVLSATTSAAQTTRPQQTARPATISTSASSPTCAQLGQRFVSSNKTQAALFAEGFGDNSAARETNRQLKIQNERLSQQMTLQVMIAKSCSIPTEESSELLYMIPALGCATKRLTQSSGVTIGTPPEPEECDRSKWQPLSAQQ